MTITCGKGIGWGAALVVGVALAGCAEDLDYEGCYAAERWVYSSADVPRDEVLEHPDTARLLELLRASYDAAGYADAVEIVDAAMVRVDIWTRLCVDTVLQVDWYASRTRTCFDRQLQGNEPFPDEAMQSAFEQHVATLPPLPGSIISLEQARKAANGCHRGIAEQYVPCTNLYEQHALEVTFTRSSGKNECGAPQHHERVTVDLVGGDVVECESHHEPTCPDNYG